MSQLSADHSCYDEGDDDDNVETREHIARYGQEVMKDKVRSTSDRQPSHGFDTGSLNLHLEHGPQTFEKESEDADRSDLR